MAAFDVAQLAQEVTPYITAAIGAYGTAVLTQLEDSAADASVSYGRRTIQRMVGRRQRQEPPTPLESAIATTIAEIAANPADSDLVTLLRQEIRRAFASDPELTAEIIAWNRPPLAPSTIITASGERSLAAHTITGNIHTGDVITNLEARNQPDIPLHVTAGPHNNYIMTMIVPIEDRDPEIGPRPLGARVTVEAFTSQAVILNRMRPIVISRYRARPCYLRYRMGIPLPPRAFKTNLDEARPTLKPKENRDGPPPDFPYTVTDSGPELFLIFVESDNEVNWILELDWSSAGRSGTITIDDNGKPFHFHPGAPTIDPPQRDMPENWPVSHPRP
ncbi:hypothetical protein AB0L42_30930 [Streptomyces sp. NPDC052287]|uniref:hypothetical protein n=1 Tax=Streptomyces sp. NPDC052287 TaxID=3154950 RepID=UPI00341E5CC2